ncbi:diadenosine tetraphosphate (Ap4A) HIT family hydrolase [Kushneria sinocarnis]|uniref:Diadenosine tetraphosphate (Ap4A) HIT family hydrolase n=1 Tax=Kushneria sinocarnis TaxID=595502 RepID=A0A420WU27_9GAMM|nr:HIT family protein [Kushneria sinocarnis]RKQ96949.1 diadenosine tetraphosphate (Ap4A) HIT family hydrolase [Kushneria sinocarnis]
MHQEHMDFELHPQLATDSLLIRELALSQWRLMNDARFIWTLLIPRRPEIRESFQLPSPERDQLWREVDAVGAALHGAFPADKVNIGALGNRVAQLHVHVLLRHREDAAWPGPVWGHGQPEPLSEARRDERLAALEKLSLDDI